MKPFTAATLTALVILSLGAVQGRIGRYDELTVGKLQVEALSVRDENGILRIVLGLNEDKPFIGMYDSKGNAKLSVITSDDSGQISIFKGEKFSATLGDDKTSSALKLYDNNGTPRVVVGATTVEGREDALIVILDEEGNPAQIIQ